MEPSDTLKSDISNDIVKILSEFDSFLDNVFESPLSSPTSDCSDLTYAFSKYANKNNENEASFQNAKSYFQNNCGKKPVNVVNALTNLIDSTDVQKISHYSVPKKSAIEEVKNEECSSTQTSESFFASPYNITIKNKSSLGPVIEQGTFTTFKSPKVKPKTGFVSKDPRLKSYDKVVEQLQCSKLSNIDNKPKNVSLINEDTLSTVKTSISNSSISASNPTIQNVPLKTVFNPPDKSDVCPEEPSWFQHHLLSSSQSKANVSFEDKIESQKKTSDPPSVNKDQIVNELKIKELEEQDLLFYAQTMLSSHTAKIAAGIMSVEHRGTKALELWTRRATQGYEGVGITNMTTAWRDGLAFCALIHHFRPDIIDFKSLKGVNILENNALAFRVAEQQLGIPALLDAEDMVETEVPDRLSILTYVSQFYQAFSAQGLIGPGGRRSPSTPTTDKKSPPAPSPNTTIKTTKPAAIVSPVRAKPISQPPATIQTKTEKPEFKTDKVTMGVRGRREECFVCSKPVFLAERLLIGFPGQLRHRTCFKCDRCATQLTLASYYETEKGQFCCETCPDEERPITQEDEKDLITSPPPPAPKDEASSSGSESDSDDEAMSGSDEGGETSSSVKPRSVFLRQTLEEGAPLQPPTHHNDSKPHSGSNRCDSALKATNPPDQVLDTGQSDANRSSLVLSRRKIFENNSSTNHLVNNYNNYYQTSVNKETVTSATTNPVEESKNPTNKVENELLKKEEPSQEKLICNNKLNDKPPPESEELRTTDIAQTPPPPKPKRLFLDDTEVPKSSNPVEEISTSPVEDNPFASDDEEEEEESKSESTVPSIVIDQEESEVTYPEELNPFDSEPSENEEQQSTPPPNTTSVVPPTPKMCLNPFGESEEEIEETKKSSNPFLSEDEDSDSSFSTLKSNKVPPPRPPPPTLRRDATSSPMRLIQPPSGWTTPPSPSLSLNSSSSEQNTLRLKKKLRIAPAPPCLSPSQNNEGSPRDAGLTAKMQKDLKNQTNKMMGGACRSDSQTPSSVKSLSTPKSERGEWRRKKGPAPLLPVPQKRSIRKLPMRQVQQELNDIEIKQTELERQGVLLETTIRERTENVSSTSTSPTTDGSSEAEKTSMSSNSSSCGVEVEDMILQLFELVNEKNELFRRQTELMYLKREKRLEEEYVELEYQIRCLMLKPQSERTEQDLAHEENLIERLVKLVEQRDEIVNCLEMERQREAIEDESIASHLIKYQEKHIDGIDSDEGKKELKKKKKLRLLKKKKKKKKDKEKPTKIDADKDIDESELKKKKKKNWFKKPLSQS